MTTRSLTARDISTITETLKRVLEHDMWLIKEERKDLLTPSDPKRNKMSLRVSKVSFPYGVPDECVPELGDFFRSKGWRMVKISKSPSIKLERIKPFKATIPK